MKKDTVKNPRLGKVGGQAVMEGVMMRSASKTAIAVRRTDDKTIVVRESTNKSLRDKNKFFNLPIIRGIVNLVEMLFLSFNTLTASTEMMGLDGLESDSESKVDKWIDEHFGKGMLTAISIFSTVLGLALAILLFVMLPAFVTNLTVPASVEGTWELTECGFETQMMMDENKKTYYVFDQPDAGNRFYIMQEGDTELGLTFGYTFADDTLTVSGGILSGSVPVDVDNTSMRFYPDDEQRMMTFKKVSSTKSLTYKDTWFTSAWWRNRLKCLIEGLIKIVVFIAYLWLTSLLKDIRRVYQYHGAEHKSIFCYEAGLELTVENVKKQSRFHPRCGTSFMFVMVFLSIFVSIVFIPDVWGWLRILLKILLLPLCVGLGYEFIRYAGKHDNKVTRALSAPGLWMQRITTREPDDSMMEVAITSIKAALHDEYPDFEIPYESEYLARKKAAEEAKETEEQQEEPAEKPEEPKQEDATDAAAGIQDENV